MTSNGYIINDRDRCIYTKFNNENCGVIVCLYVDDLLIFGTNIDVIYETKNMLSTKFDMKDLGEANVILGINLRKVCNGYMISQDHYVEKMLKRFGHYNVNPVSTPYDSCLLLKKYEGPSVSQSEYAQIIGCLMYLTNCTRPDISYAVNRLSRYTHNPNKDHWTALCRVLEYLRDTIGFGLYYCGNPAVLEGYSDAN